MRWNARIRSQRAGRRMLWGGRHHFGMSKRKLRKNHAVFGGVTETMGFLHFFGAMIAIFCVFPHHFAETLHVFVGVAKGGEKWSPAACLTNHRNGVDSLPPFTTQTLAGWRWQYDLAVAALLDRRGHPRYVCWDVSRCAIWIAQERFKDEI